MGGVPHEPSRGGAGGSGSERGVGGSAPGSESAGGEPSALGGPGGGGATGAPPGGAGAGSGAPPAGGGGVREFAKLWGFLGFVVVVLALARETILPFVFAILLAYILAPVVGWLAARARLPRGVAILLCYAGILGALAIFLAGVFPRLVEDVERVGREAPELYTQITDEWAPGLAAWIEERFPGEEEEPAEEPRSPPVAGEVPLPPGTQLLLTPLPDGRTAVEIPEGGLHVTQRSGGGYAIEPGEAEEEPSGAEEMLREWAQGGLATLQDQLGQLVRLGQAVVVGVISSAFSLVLVLLIAAFILIDVDRVKGFARSLVPARYRREFDGIAASVDRGLAGVIRGQLIICVINAVLTYAGLVLFDVNYALTLSVIAGLLSIIPILGVILSTIPIVLVALVSGEGGVDFARGLTVLAWIVGINVLEGNILSPKILGSSARMHPLLVIFALLFGLSSFGIAGALLAVPAASVVQVLFLHFRSVAWRNEAPESDAGSFR